MEVFVTGGSGYVGSAVVAELTGAGYRVRGLARSDKSAARLKALGATPVPGSLAAPDVWTDALAASDTVIHLAATFDEDMARTDRRFIDILLAQVAKGGPRRLVYTGGVWLYGACADPGVAEGAPFDPLPEFAFMGHHRERLFSQPDLHTSLVHPGLVWDEGGGMIQPLLADAAEGRALRIPATEDIRWPLVHRTDLARLYRLALEGGEHGLDYHGVAEVSVPVRAIAGEISRQAGIKDAPISDRDRWSAGSHLSQRVGAETTGLALDWEPRHPGILSAHFKIA